MICIFIATKTDKKSNRIYKTTRYYYEMRKVFKSYTVLPTYECIVIIKLILKLHSNQIKLILVLILLFNYHILCEFYTECEVKGSDKRSFGWIYFKTLRVMLSFKSKTEIPGTSCEWLFKSKLRESHWKNCDFKVCG